jgi:hypothetical protein
MKIKSLRDIEKLRTIINLDSITIYTKRLKYKSLFQYALKYAFWSLKDQGKLIIIDNGPFKVSIKPYKISVYQINQTIFQFLKDSVELVERDFNKGKIILKIKKKEQKKTANWSCGIIYSGNTKEKQQLVVCLKGLYNQKQFQERNAEVIICGPSNGDYSFTKEFPKNIKIIHFDNDLKNGRFLISKKKNYLIRQFKNDNCIVLHTRIVFDKNTLDQIPTSFDFVSPMVYTLGSYGKKRYLDFLNNASYDPTRVLKELIIPRNYNSKDYLKKIKFGLPFIDGGVMIFKRDILLDCPLNNHLAWFENEDVELASRLHLNGFLLDFAFNVKALSISNKVNSKSTKYKISDLNFFMCLLKIRYSIKSFITHYMFMLQYHYYKRY